MFKITFGKATSSNHFAKACHYFSQIK